MKKKNKKGEIKQEKKSSARFKSLYLENGKVDRIFVKQPDIPPSQLKESAKAMKVAMPHSHGDLIEGSGATAKKKLTRAEKKAHRKKAKVVPINSKSLGKTGREVHKDKAVNPPPVDTSEQIAKLEAHITKHEAAKNDATIVGPPTPSPKVTKASAEVHSISNGYDFASKKQGVVANDSNDEDWYLTYGKKVRDTGRGMTPSGLPITDFLEGGPFAPPKKESELQTVTETANEDWTYEELASNYDQLQLDMHSQKVEYEKRLDVKNASISEMEKVILQLRQAERVEQFNDSHSYNHEDAVVKLETDLAFAQREVEDQKAEINLLMDQVEKLGRHATPEGSQVTASEFSKATLKTLANQFNIFKSQWNDDPLKAYLKLSPYDPRQVKLLRWYFDQQCDGRIEVSDERKVYRKWASRPVPALRWSVRRRNAKRRVPAEVEALRNIGVNTAVLRPTPDWHCNKLKVTDCNGLADRNIRMDTSPLAGEVCHDAYCKVWEGFKSVTPRAEWEHEVRNKRREEQAKAVQETATYKAIKPVLEAIRTVDKALNYELSSKKRAELKRQQKLEKKRAKAEASRIKREREDKWEREQHLERVKEAQRIAY